MCGTTASQSDNRKWLMAYGMLCQALMGHTTMCGGVETQPWQLMCIHEHLVQLWLCADHYTEEGRRKARCRVCWQLGHECAVKFQPAR